jgi:hypothetical protein
MAIEIIHFLNHVSHDLSTVWSISDKGMLEELISRPAILGIFLETTFNKITKFI